MKQNRDQKPNKKCGKEIRKQGERDKNQTMGRTIRKTRQSKQYRISKENNYMSNTQRTKTTKRGKYANEHVQKNKNCVRKTQMPP